MTLETYLAYLLAIIVVLIIHGPTIMLVVSCTSSSIKTGSMIFS